MRTKKTLVQFGLFLVAGAIVAALAIGGPATSFGATPATKENECGVPMTCPNISGCVVVGTSTVDTSQAGTSKSDGSPCSETSTVGHFPCPSGGYEVAGTNCH